ncbi:thiamine pyrophosphate-dependent dehydrogenase E1 component subunit alpha [Natrialbaceae archaeon A-CW1-1]
MTRAVFDRGPTDMVQVLDRHGKIVDPVLFPDLEDETFVSLYRDMRRARRLDERLISLQRQGRMGTYASLAGQEGAQIGSTYALEAADQLFFQYREHSTLIARELPWEYVLYWMGHEDGNAAIADANVFPLNITIGDHIPHAVGWSWASKLAGDEHATVVHFGDGATSEGDFHEGLNFAGVYDTPTIFVCNNNQWAISTPSEHQTASETFAQKADAYGFDGVLVDGMDPLATYAVTRAAREKALEPDDGEARPTLIEAVQYRYGAHTTADDPTVYREDESVAAWKERDPLERLEAFLRDCSLLDDEIIAAMDEEADTWIAGLIDRAEAKAGEADPLSMFDDVYAEPTPRVAEGRNHLQWLREEHGDAALLEER